MGDSYRRSVKIFIGGLSFETTDEALRRYFEQFGPVADAIVMKDAVSRRSRGFGFITYVNTASVDAALAVDQHIVDNRRVEAKRAVPRSEVPKLCLHLAVFYLYHEEPPFARVCQMESPLTASPLLQPVQPWESGFGMDGYMVRGVPEQQRTRSNSTVSAGSMGGMAGLDGASMACKIFVGGLHYETRDSSLRQYFEHYGPVTTAEVMFNRETHKSRGFGFVVFENEESANAVLQSTHHTVNGKVVEVKRAVPRSQSSTGGSNPSSPALMGYPPSPGGLAPGGGGGGLGKATNVAPKRTQRTRSTRDTMVTPSSGAGHVPPGASPQQQRYPPTTSYAAVLRYGAGRQQHTNLGPTGGGKPPQHHGHLQTRDDIGTFRFQHPHTTLLHPSATARAEAAAAHAFVQELKAWDSENMGEGLSFDDSFDYYGEQRIAPRDYGSHVDIVGSSEAGFNSTLQASNTWPGPGPGPGSGSSSRTWVQAGQGSVGRQPVPRPSASTTRVLSHSNRIEEISPRQGSQFPTFHREADAIFEHENPDLHAHLLCSTVRESGDDYHNGHRQRTASEGHNTRLLSPGEGGGTPALMGSSPLLGGGGLLETAFQELSLDGNHSSVGLSSSFSDGVPNGDGPSLLSGLGGGGPPSAASEVLPYGRAGGETAIDGGGRPEGLVGNGSWRADAFGSALGVSVTNTSSEMEGFEGVGGRGGVNDVKDLSGGGLSDHFLGSLGTAGTERTNSQLRWN